MDELLELLRYHRWATERTLSAVAAVGASDYTKDLGSSFPSLRDTLVHLYTADRAWLGRLEGEHPPRANPNEYATVEALREPWGAVLERWPLAAQRLGDPGRVVEYRTFAGEPFSNSLGEIVRHVVNHGSYHRGQVTTMLRQLGVTAASTDMIYHFREQRPGTA